MLVFSRYVLAGAGLILFTGLAHAQADEVDKVWPKFEIAVGGFVTNDDTTAQINSEALGAGVNVNLEDALGIDASSNTIRADLLYRFGETRRHEIEFHYFDNKRDGSKVLEEDIQVGDQIFPAGTGVNSENRLTFYNLDYVYNFLLDDRVRLGGSVGLHTTGIKLDISETGGGRASSDSFTAPLPMLGLRLDVVLAKHWRMKTAINFFYIEYDNYTGRLSDTLVAVEYAPWKHFGLGAGFNAIYYDIEADGGSDFTSFNGSLEYRLTGFMLYAKYFF
jgi:hypothetical protein